MYAQSRKTVTMLTLGQASEVLDLSKGTLRRLADRGAIRVCRTGKRGDRRFRPEDVAIFLLMVNKGFLLNGRAEQAGGDGGVGKTEWLISRRSLSSLHGSAQDPSACTN
jgi:excisionase family DNA binding protein